MKDILIGIALATLSMVFAITQSFADEVLEAERICYGLRDTGLISACEVDPSRKHINFRANLNIPNARTMCNQIVDLALLMTTEFQASDDAWEIAVFSPHVGPAPIAVCKFRQ